MSTHARHMKLQERRSGCAVPCSMCFVIFLIVFDCSVPDFNVSLKSFIRNDLNSGCQIHHLISTLITGIRESC